MLKSVLRLAPHPEPPNISRLVAALSGEIESGAWPVGARLPSVRALARERGASRYAVVEAYDRLVASGYVVAKRGSGYFVTGPRRRVRRDDRAAPGQHRAFNVAGLIREVLEAEGTLLNLGGPWVPEDWVDTPMMQSIVRGLGRGPAGHLWRYGTPKGYLPLRDQLQVMLRGIGIEAASDQIVLTNGSSHALDLIIRNFLKPGDAVLVEDPGYYNLFGYLRLCGVNLVGVPRLADGPDIAALRAAAAQHRPKLFFVQPVLQNPTGTDIPPQGLHRILQTAAEFDFRVVEDDTYGDLALNQGPRLATLDQLERVIYVRSFSKTLSGSLRAGMLAAPPAIVEELTNVKILSCITTSEFIERFVYRVLVEGHYRRYIDRLQERFATARAATQKLFARHGLEIFAMPSGANFLWARFPDVEDSTALVPRAREKGILLGAGRAFRPNLEPTPWMRFNVTLCGDPRVAQFLREH